MEPASLDKSEDLSDIKHFFQAYLHQDWTIDGNTLEEVFENNHGLEGIREGVGTGARILIDSDLTEHRPGILLVRHWSAGYEPEDEDLGTWRGILKEIVRLCDAYDRP
ncbi:hypothetical protein ABZ631_06200 [Nocardiopsis alba]|uniref:contact-dependent growth inhibition system immunity protein n=1 Tax=Nocardiopsis alba TaxID=53437 RepID=UPI0033C4C706